MLGVGFRILGVGSWGLELEIGSLESFEGVRVGSALPCVRAPRRPGARSTRAALGAWRCGAAPPRAAWRNGVAQREGRAPMRPGRVAIHCDRRSLLVVVHSSLSFTVRSRSALRAGLLSVAQGKGHAGGGRAGAHPPIVDAPPLWTPLPSWTQQAASLPRGTYHTPGGRHAPRAARVLRAPGRARRTECAGPNVPSHTEHALPHQMRSPTASIPPAREVPAPPSARGAVGRAPPPPVRRGVTVRTTCRTRSCASSTSTPLNHLPT